MGQDYSDSEYKKSYTEDYVKSYKSGHVYIYEPPAQEKKQSKDSVLAEGRRRTPRHETRPVAKAPKPEPKKAEAKPQPVAEQKAEPKQTPAAEPVIEIKPQPIAPKPKTEIKIEIPPQKPEPQKEELPPLFDLESIFNKKEEKTNSKTLKYPIKHLHGTTYLDVFSGREISEDRARELLYAAGFNPKIFTGIIPIFIGILIVFFFGNFGLIPVLLAGFWLFKKDETTYTKLSNMEKLNFSMPATKYETMMYKFQAAICFIVAIIAFASKII